MSEVFSISGYYKDLNEFFAADLSQPNLSYYKIEDGVYCEINKDEYIKLGGK